VRYKPEVSSEEHFIKRVARDLIPHGYFFYVTGTIPTPKDVTKTDAKIISQYNITFSRSTRSRRRKEGLANVQYVRLGRFFVIIATHGKGAFFEMEKGIQDLRNAPLNCGIYAIGLRKNKPLVWVTKKTYREKCTYFLDLAVHRTKKALESEFQAISWRSYQGVNLQKALLLQQVNQKRKTAGFELISPTYTRKKAFY